MYLFKHRSYHNFLKFLKKNFTELIFFPIKWFVNNVSHSASCTFPVQSLQSACWSEGPDNAHLERREPRGSNPPASPFPPPHLSHLTFPTTSPFPPGAASAAAGPQTARGWRRPFCGARAWPQRALPPRGSDGSTVSLPGTPAPPAASPSTNI